MAKVFISHAGPDDAVARAMHVWLAESGHEVFVDVDRTTGLVLGEVWEERLYERLRWADVMICLVTSAYSSSKWCFAEIIAAKTLGKTILPISVERAAIHPLLDVIQHSDYAADADAARNDIAAALRDVDAAGGWGWPEGRSPFPGLRAFDTDMSRVFFGRRAEIEALVGSLRSPAQRTAQDVTVVVGPSGCGKSSLVRAGLIPAIEREPGWCVLPPILPGEDPVAALASEIAVLGRRLGMGWTLGDVRNRLAADDGLVGLARELIVASATADRRPTRLLIVIDQLEELITLAAAPARAQLAALLRHAVAGPVSVVATVRPEYLDPLLVGAELAGVPMRLFPLRPLRDDALAAVIEGPARLAGLAIDQGLVARLVADTGSGEALPLLAYALEQMTEGFDRGGRLTLERYDGIGGVSGALSRQADAALLAALSAGRTEDEVMASLLRLVTVDEGGQPTRRRIYQDGQPEQVRRDLSAFVAHRLVTADMEGEAVVLSVAHESFLTRWAPFTRAVGASEAALRRGRDLEQAAKEWADAGRSAARLWERGQLAAAVDDLKAHAAKGGGAASEIVSEKVELSPPAREFLGASIRRDRAKRRRATVIASSLAVVFFVLATGAGVAAVIAYRQGRVAANERNAAEGQQRIAVARQLVARASNLYQSDPGLALRLGLAAQRISPGPETNFGLVSTLMSTPFAGRIESGTALWSVAFSSNGSLLAAGGVDGTLRLFDVSIPGKSQLLGDPVSAAGGNARVVFADDRTILTSGTSGGVKIWDVSQRRPIQKSLVGSAETDYTTGLAVSPNGQTVATAGDANTLRLWSIAKPEAVLVGGPYKDRGIVRSMAFTPDGKTLVTGGTGALVVWAVDPAKGLRKLGELSGPDWSDQDVAVAVSADGRTLAAGASRNVTFWNIKNPAKPNKIGEPMAIVGSYVRRLAFPPTGTTFAVLTEDGRAMLWETADPAKPQLLRPPFTGHQGAVNHVQFSPHADSLATAGSDGLVMMWRTGMLPPQLGSNLVGHTSSVSSSAFSPNGLTLATGSEDKSIRLWDVSDPDAPVGRSDWLYGHDGSVFAVAFQPGAGSLLASAGADRSVVLWDTSDPAVPAQIAEIPDFGDFVESILFSPTGDTLVTADDSGKVILWDVSKPESPRKRAGGDLSFGEADVWALAFSVEGKTLVAGNSDGELMAWDVSNPDSPRALLDKPFAAHANAVGTMALSRDGTLITGSEDHRVIAWDVSDWTAPREMATLRSVGSAVNFMRLSPNGETLAAGAADGTLTLWDMTTATPILLGASVQIHRDAIWSLAFSPDGQTLATTSTDEAISLWNIGALTPIRDQPITRACALVGVGFTEAEWEANVPDLPFQRTCEAATK